MWMDRISRPVSTIHDWMSGTMFRGAVITVIATNISLASRWWTLEVMKSALFPMIWCQIKTAKETSITCNLLMDMNSLAYTPQIKFLLAFSFANFENWGVPLLPLVVSKFANQFHDRCLQGSGHFKIRKWKGEEFLFYDKCTCQQWDLSRSVFDYIIRIV